MPEYQQEPKHCVKCEHHRKNSMACLEYSNQCVAPEVVFGEDKGQYLKFLVDGQIDAVECVDGRKFACGSKANFYKERINQ